MGRIRPHQFVRVEAPQPVPHALRFWHGKASANLQIETASRETFAKQACQRYQRYVNGHRHDVYHIVLYTGGRNRMLLDETVYPCRPGLLVGTAPQQRHEFRPRDAAAVRYCQVTFSAWAGGKPLRLSLSDLLTSLTQAPVPEAAGRLQLEPTQAQQIEASIATIIDCSEQASDLRVQKMGHALLETLLHVAECMLSRTKRAARDDLVVVRQLIDQRFTEPLAVADLAAQVGWSEGHLHRQFKARYGVSPIAYQIKQRVEAAQNLLASSDHTLAELAARLGFSDQYHLSRTFKQQVGMSPGRYRQQLRRASVHVGKVVP